MGVGFERTWSELSAEEKAFWGSRIKYFNTRYPILNREKKRKYDRCYAARHKERKRLQDQKRDKAVQVNQRLLTLYGITLDEYTKLSEAQDNKCKLCKRESKNRKLCVDHCHDTGRIRGLLCVKCNTALGTLGDTVPALRSVIGYLEGNTRCSLEKRLVGSCT